MLTTAIDVSEVVTGDHCICVPGWKNTSRLSGKLQWRRYGSKHTTSLASILFVHPRQPDSKFAQNLKAVTFSPQYRSVRPLAELFARATWSFVTAKTEHLWPILNETVLVFEGMTRNIQDAWSHNPWVNVQTEEEIPEQVREILTEAWGVLKTILFVTVMVQQSVITATIYLPQPSIKIMSSLEPDVTPASVTWTLLQVLSNLSFVITKFGGVTLTARTSAFPQLRRLFYSALDVLSVNQAASEKFVLFLCQSGKQDALSAIMESANMAFSLACIEQLVPNVDEEKIQSQIFDMCIPYVFMCSFSLFVFHKRCPLQESLGSREQRGL